MTGLDFHSCKFFYSSKEILFFHIFFFFSPSLLICNLILRAVTSIVLLRVYNERNDRFGSHSSDTRPFASDNSTGNTGYQSNGRGYENLDTQPTPTGVSVGTNNGTNFSQQSSNNLNSYQSVPSPFSLVNEN